MLSISEECHPVVAWVSTIFAGPEFLSNGLCSRVRCRRSNNDLRYGPFDRYVLGYRVQHLARGSPAIAVGVEKKALLISAIAFTPFIAPRSLLMYSPRIATVPLHWCAFGAVAVCKFIRGNP